jgi:hypothetical protein
MHRVKIASRCLCRNSLHGTGPCSLRYIYILITIHRKTTQGYGSSLAFSITVTVPKQFSIRYLVALVNMAARVIKARMA